MSKPKESLIGALVEMSKRGDRGERDNAMRSLKRLCEKHGLDINDVLDSKKIEEFTLEYKQAQYLDLASQVVLRYGVPDDDTQIMFNKHHKVLFWKTTKAKYIEALNAFEVLLPKYKAELKIAKRAFLVGFVQKHNLYYHPTEEEMKKREEREQDEPEELTADERKARRMADGIGRNLDDVEIQKRLS
jgi:hypothetical protein